MGFTQIDLAKSGEEALSMMAKQVYKLVFMDCHMPQIDGFEAFRRIRNGEAGAGNKRTIVIAVTANAMATDRDACLNTGMDDYLSKPIDQHKLHALLGKWLSGDARKEDRFESPSADNSGISENSSCPINLTQMEVFTDGDPEQEKILSDIFLQANEPVLDILRQHVLGGNSDDAWKAAAHKLKGSAAQTGADRLSALCRKAQEGFNRLSPEQKQSLLAEIEGSFREVREFFESRF
jgi:CheY-like chemotaxis protein